MMKHTPGLVIRFDGPPSHESGRFVEVEIDGISVNIGEWVQDGDDWLLVLGNKYAAAPDLLEALENLMDNLSQEFDSNEAYDMAQSAIAKASGSQ